MKILRCLFKDATKKVRAKVHGLKEKKDSLVYASNTGFIPLFDRNFWRVALDNCRETSDLLINCMAEGRSISELPERLIPSSFEEAYAVQAYIEKPNNPRVGWKLAATSKEGQKHIGVSGPMIGRITSKMSLAFDDIIPAKANNMMVAEPEFVFVFNTSIEPRAQTYTRAEGMELVSELKLGIEFPNSRYMKFETAGELSLIADNACAHQLILGPTAPEIWRDLSLPDHKVIGWIDSKSNYEGIGSNVLGGPINALLWFLDEASKRKLVIKEGDFVTTGTVTQPMPFQIGDNIIADFGALGEVRCRIENN